MVWLYLVLLCPGILHGAPQQTDAGADHIEGGCWWCPTTPVPPITTTVASASTTEYSEGDATMCECVPWYLCGNGAIITDGAGLLDLRTIPVKRERNVMECPNPIHTCCGIPIPLDVANENPNKGDIIDLPSNTPCECMNYMQCPEHLIVSNGQGNTCLNVAQSSSSHSKCPRATDVCCANAEEVDEALISALTSALIDASNLEDCDCVEPYMCDEQGYIKDNYEDSLNEVETNRRQRGKITTMSVNVCSNSGKVCCRQRVECECVNQDQCDEEGFIITDGAAIIDVRMFGSQSQPQGATQGTCGDKCQVCCKLREEEEEPTIDTSTSTSTPTPIPTEDDTPPTTITTPAPTITTPTASYIPACSKRNRKGTLNLRIMGFQDDQSQFGEFPWVATVLREELIANKPHHLFVGGGTLIHPRVVLTAAHKVNLLSSDKLHIRLGEWDTQTVKELLPHQDIEVERVVIHPEFERSNLFHNLALIFLKEEAATNDHIQKICLASDTSQVNTNDCVINGWGKDGFDNTGEYQKIMKSITLPLVDSTTCQTQLRRTRLGGYFRLHDSFTCAGGGAGQDACKGDGGGPLACAVRGGDKDTYLLVGITAWGIGCGDEGVPGVYVDIPHHFDWINEEIEAVYPTTTAAPTTVTQGCPTDCNADEDYVCGNNGRTYGNPCELTMANCHDPTISLKHKGACSNMTQKEKLQKKKKANKKKKEQERQQRRGGNE